MKNPKDLIKSVHQLIEDHSNNAKEIEQFLKEKSTLIKAELLTKMEEKNGLQILSEKIELNSTDAIRDLAFELQRNCTNLVAAIGSVVNDKASITICISENLISEKGFNAGEIVREIASEIKGGGGGQAHFATAGGTDTKGIEAALKKFKNMFNS
jgi:alanyl-tRNA synthetase